MLQQQERFDAFIDEFNNRRPHEALSMQCPAEVYRPSSVPFPEALPELKYPMHDDVCEVRPKGLIYFDRRLHHLSDALTGELVGVREEDDGAHGSCFSPIHRPTCAGGVVDWWRTV